MILALTNKVEYIRVSRVVTTAFTNNECVFFWTATANNLTKSLPNASSDSDLPRFRHKSPSISNETPEAAAARAAIKDNSQSSTTSKFLKDMQAHSKHHVGEKVAQVRSRHGPKPW
ncbi:hypothetical protein CEXT_120991 [Caerostris extrusa]|uniref:Uncharacterized protein n=1 Tax=Caerostris extrusa TaxID=172846 RepID=A0AAV4XTW8_CAEEX|nr:hypothetical protein CEXT_120991 [Caerostris extrusa]